MNFLCKRISQIQKVLELKTDQKEVNKKKIKFIILKKKEKEVKKVVKTPPRNQKKKFRRISRTGENSKKKRNLFSVKKSRTTHNGNTKSFSSTREKLRSAGVSKFNTQTRKKSAIRNLNNTYLLGYNNGKITLAKLKVQNNMMEKGKIKKEDEKKFGENFILESVKTKPMKVNSNSSRGYRYYQNRDFAKNKLYSKSFDSKRRIVNRPRDCYVEYSGLKNPNILLLANKINLE